MSYYGSSFSKFKSINVSPATVIDLRHSIIIPNWGIENLIKNVSVFTRGSNFIDKEDDFSEFTVECNIFDNASPTTTLANLMLYDGDLCNFMPHEDNNKYVQAKGGVSDAKFQIESMLPVYLATQPPNTKVKLIVKFVSVEPVDASASIL